jgi:hypothetical protein
VIGKVLCGTYARRLLYYLYGPGKANEHSDPHLVAGFSDPGEQAYQAAYCRQLDKVQ